MPWLHIPQVDRNLHPGTFAQSLATIYIFAQVRIIGTLVPFVRQGISRNFLLHQKNPAVKLSYRIKNPCKTTQLPDLSFIFDLSSYFN